MVLDIAFHPEGKKSTKDLIITSLTKTPSLTIRQIHNSIKRDYLHIITYQGVHKVVRELSEQGVLIKEGKDYSINPVWVRELESFIEKVKGLRTKDSSLSLEGIKSITNEGDSQVIVFNSFGEAEKYRKKLQSEYLSKPQPKAPYCSHAQHFKSPLVYSERSIHALELVDETMTECYLIVAGSTIPDEWCAAYYRSTYVNVLTGIPGVEKSEIYVMGDLILQMYIPKELRDFIDISYTNIERIENISIPNFYHELYEKKIDIKIIVYKNTELAQQLRSQIINHFSRMQNASFIDIDKTLVDDYLIMLFAKHLVEKKVFDQSISTSIYSLRSEYEKGKLRYSEFAKNVVNLFAKGLEGKKVSEITDLAKTFVTTAKIPYFSYTKSLFSIIKKYGITVALSGSPKMVIDALRHDLPFDFVLATEFEVVDGVYNGKVLNNLSLDYAKDKAFKEFLATHQIRLGKAFGFGDTHHDRSFLERVGHPIALNPNKRLRELALEQHWFIPQSDTQLFEKINKIVEGSHDSSS